LKKKTAEADFRAMASREEQIELGEIRIEFTACDGGARSDNTRVAIERDFFQAAEIDEERFIAEAAGDPTVAAGTNRDFEIALVGEADGVDYIVDARCEDYSGRITMWMDCVEEAIDSGLLVGRVATPNHFSTGHDAIVVAARLGSQGKLFGLG
jgi:hypothetical protein